MKKGKVISAIAAILMVSACATIEGAGEDIESLGDAIADEARD